MKAKDPLRSSEELAVGHPHDDAKPLLMLDIDGVISLFGAGHPGALHQAGAQTTSLDGSFHSIDGIPHFLSSTAATHLLALADIFDLVWASGWEERANEHLPHLLGLPPGLPFLRFERGVGRSNAHWKLDAIDAYARERPLAWVDDALNDACYEWASARTAPTLLVQTEPERGLTGREAALLRQWGLAPARYSSVGSPSGSSSSASSSAKPGSVPPAPIRSSEARSASNS
jgi:HAD domain in Swiss Army Knife RNA repair proteins